MRSVAELVRAHEGAVRLAKLVQIGAELLEEKQQVRALTSAMRQQMGQMARIEKIKLRAVVETKSQSQMCWAG